MKRYLPVILIFSLLAGGCDDSNKPGKIGTSGTDTIDNLLYGIGPYYAIGFDFSIAEKISTLSNPPPDITIDVYTAPDVLLLQTPAGINGFHLTGEYDNAVAAKEAFDNLTSFDISDWDEWANPVKPNQVWIYRSADEHYAKLRIITTSYETRTNWDYAECTFEWVYQPDGSLTFPGK